MTEGAFFQDLALLMAVAGLVSVLFTRLKWPKVIGYILAGILLSRHTWGCSMLADESSVQAIARLGIVFLMFTLGLEFSASDMKKVKSVTLPTAIIDTVLMTWIGYTIGRSFFHWGPVASLFLGAAICDSSTTLLAKIIDEMKWSKRPFVKYVIGTSVTEDIICVGMIALITGVAGGKGMNLGAVGQSLGGLMVFFLATLVFGLVLVPRLLTSIARAHDDEALLLTILGCCFFVSYIAFKLDYSLALGAFLVGILGAGSEVRERLHRLADPLRSMFAAVFFVSIGLLVDPVACFHNLPAILVLSAVVIIGKGTNCFVGAMVSGETLKTSLQMGFSLAQIGEFAYLVALLYMSISGDPSDPMYQIVVGVSLLTTVLNPVMLKASEPAGNWIEEHCPPFLRKMHDSYRATLAKFRSTRAVGPDRAAIRKAVITLVIIAVLEFAVAVALSMLDGCDWSGLSVFFDSHKRFIFCLVMNLFAVSMFAPVVVVSRRLAVAVSHVLTGDGTAGWQIAVDRVVRLVVHIAAVLLFFLELGMMNVNLAPDEPLARFTIFVIFLLALVFGWRFFLRSARGAASLLGEALASDRRGYAVEEMRSFTIPADAIAYYRIGAESPAVSETVVSLNIRAQTGAVVVSVRRDGERTQSPGPDWIFMPGDIVGVVGDAEQKLAVARLFGVNL